MPGSQLKRLKASLREQGIVGPQQSKKQKRKNAQDERAKNEKRLHRGVVLEGIREQFNPFDLKHVARGPKFDVTSSRPAPSIKGRPGAAKAASEERRRQTLLVAMQRRNKVGGILDRRFGEGDTSLNEEEKALERFAREKQRSHKRMSMFDLEEDDEPIEALTHGGKALAFDNEDEEELRDDFDEDDIGNESDESERGKQRLKRLRAMDGVEGDEPERKKTKKEVMEEVIAKSKLHKMERQAAKEEDDDLRTELDKELPDIQRLLYAMGNQAALETGLASRIAGVDRQKFDRDFDIQVKKFAQDKRAQPSDRTKTEEEKAEDNAKRLKRLEDKRQRRMRGEEVTDSDESSGSEEEADHGQEGDAIEEEEEEDDFGLGAGIRMKPTATDLGFDDEDDFIIDDDLVASGSEVESTDGEDVSQDGGDTERLEATEDIDDDDDDFTKGLLSVEEARNPAFDKGLPTDLQATKQDDRGLPFTFAMPATLKEFQSMIAPYSQDAIPTIVQRIRALYHPKLDSSNKGLSATFSTILVDFIASPWYPTTSPSFAVLESLIRHVHSLAKSYPVEIGTRCRHHMEKIGQERPLALRVEDLLLLTAVGSIFPTSDHFHQVVTPSTLLMTRYLGQKVPQDLQSYATGLYLATLALQYHQLSKRYVPELINFTLNTVCALALVVPSHVGNFPLHSPPPDARCREAKQAQVKRLTLGDCHSQELSEAAGSNLKVSLLDTTLLVLDAAADTWAGKEAFIETFDQVLQVVKHVNDRNNQKHLPKAIQTRANKLAAKLERMMRLSQISRHPLELHHHRPLAIKTYVPKFEETYDPGKHYDPDRDRAELAKLKAEHKKERKGAMRELRKDANFMAREKLRAKKAKDEAYEKKYKRLVAEIQSEEGRESNAYEREKSARKRAQNR